MIAVGEEKRREEERCSAVLWWFVRSRAVDRSIDRERRRTIRRVQAGSKGGLVVVELKEQKTKKF